MYFCLCFESVYFLSFFFVLKLNTFVLKVLIFIHFLKIILRQLLFGLMHNITVQCKIWIKYISHPSEKKKNLPTYLPNLKILGRVRGNKNIFNGGLSLKIIYIELFTLRIAIHLWGHVWTWKNYPIVIKWT